MADVTFQSFQELSAAQLHAILKMRAEIFVVEQHCFYLDPDDLDLAAIHASIAARGILQAYLRIIPPRTHDEAVMLGRICVAKSARGRGLGQALVQHALEYSLHHFPAHDIAMSAQIQVQDYYAAFGFVAEGAPYDDAGIAHIHMRKAVENP